MTPELWVQLASELLKFYAALWGVFISWPVAALLITIILVRTNAFGRIGEAMSERGGQLELPGGIKVTVERPQAEFEEEKNEIDAIEGVGALENPARLRDSIRLGWYWATYWNLLYLDSIVTGPGRIVLTLIADSPEGKSTREALPWAKDGPSLEKGTALLEWLKSLDLISFQDGNWRLEDRGRKLADFIRAGRELEKPEVAD